MNNEQQQIIDEVYENYLQHYDDEYNKEQKKIQENPLHWMEMRYTNIRPYPKEMFINKCQTNDDFANRWGCKIVIKELSHQERSDLKNSPPYEYGKTANGKLIDKRILDNNNVPTKLITVIYTEKIESYV